MLIFDIKNRRWRLPSGNTLTARVASEMCKISQDQFKTRIVMVMAEDV